MKRTPYKKSGSQRLRVPSSTPPLWLSTGCAPEAGSGLLSHAEPSLRTGTNGMNLHPAGKTPRPKTGTAPLPPPPASPNRHTSTDTSRAHLGGVGRILVISYVQNLDFRHEILSIINPGRPTPPPVAWPAAAHVALYRGTAREAPGNRHSCLPSPEGDPPNGPAGQARQVGSPEHRALHLDKKQVISYQVLFPFKSSEIRDFVSQS